MAEAVIRYESVSKAFGPREVLRGLSFELHEGETCVLLGVTGTGKSLLLKLALGLLQPDEGRIYVLGQDVTAMDETELFGLRAQVGMVFQEMALFDSLSVRDNVAYRLLEERQFGSLDLSDEELDLRVRQCLRFVGLEEAIDKMPDELSGGMKRRVGLARALITQPPIMLYDSPTAGLDPVTSQQILEHVIKLRDTQRVSSLFVSHRLQDAFILANRRHGPEAGNGGPTAGAGGGEPHGDTNTRLLLLRDGGIYFDGSAQELLGSQDSYVETYLA